MPIDMKKMIADTYMELAQHKNIDKISVKDLVETCNISRQTFYYHFQDVLEVLEWRVEQDIRATLARSIKAESPKEATKIFVSACLAGRKTFERLIQSKRHAELEQIMVKAVRTYFSELFERKGVLQELNRSDSNAIINFYTFGLVGLILESSEIEEANVDRLVSQIQRIVSGEMIKFPE